eukprot:Plantae.Rhodophyta-Purpureofilum_apyrenoidigerum.ctg8263.p1 GENE.Plantae.Rhodophyta-Purpureofilum_apyrenoidigerum.ctg8263~~Plantae.Rhodophyta-Purpureofilum_apyrenoidigerum.ctg8263.p1  ORF type:complete len:254 (-),score=55.34 Plantae.Rhodophyta-Purpureofilum_apyrenoidigerum.ctg8263:109-759(-)
MVSASRDARRQAKLSESAQKQPVEKTVGGEKNGGTRTVVAKVSKYYPADDVKRPVPSRKNLHKATKLKKNMQPGTVLIMLAGSHRGKRVVFLKQLESGVLLVTGPYAVNGVPLRKVDQAYVIATSTKLDISGLDLSKFNAAYFKKDKSKKAKEGDADFMAVDSGEKKSEIPESKVQDQKTVDSSLLEALKQDAMMKAYLKTRFTLTKGQYPHRLVF